MVFVVLASGCGDNTEPAAGTDAAVDAASDGPHEYDPNMPLVSSWLAYDPVAPAGTFKNLFVLDGDGKLTFVRQDHTFKGTWDILPDGRLHTMKSTLYEANYYYVSETRLVTGAFVPSGATSGVVGTWMSRDNFDNSETDRTLELREDLTMSFTFTGDNPLSGTGTYTLDGPRLTLKTDDATFFLVAIPDLAIGQAIYERVTP